MRIQRKLLIASIVFSSLILIVTWFLLHWILPEGTDFGFNGLQGLSKLFGIILGVCLLCGAFTYFLIRLSWPSLSGMRLHEYWIQPDERTVTLRYRAVVYIMPVISFWFIGVHSFCKLGNPICTPSMGIDLLFWGYIVTLFFGVPIVFRLIEKAS